VNELELETERFPAYNEAEPDPQGKPLHEQVSNLLGMLALLWRERRLLFRRTLSAMVATLVLMYAFPNQYQATAYMNPPDMSPMSGLSLLIGMKSGMAAGLGSQMGDMLGLKSPGQIAIRQMQSRPVQDALIQRFQLRQVYRTETFETTRKALLAHTEFEEEKKTGMIAIAVLDKDPIRASQIANAYVDELGNLTAGMNAESGHKEREYFETQVQAAKEEFRKASDELGQFGGQKGALDPDSQGKALADAVGAIEGNLIATQSELKGLQQIYTDNNPQVMQAKAKIAELSAQLAKVSHGRGSQSGQAADTGATRDTSKNMDPSVQRMWGIAPSYMSLYGNMKIREAVVQTLAEQYEIAKLQESRRISNFQIMDRAEPPEIKAKPHRGLMALLAGFLVFGGLCCWIVAEDAWNRRGPEDPWKQMLQPAVTTYQERKARRLAKKTHKKQPANTSGQAN
jgi:capsule polysaccharide export protein KpsE/RkpR